MVDGRAARYAGQRERRREEFVAAALKTIAEHGPETSVEQIAAAAGIARTRVYRFFDDIADLQSAIITEGAAQLMTELAPLWNPRGSTRQLISEAVRTYLRWLSENENVYRYGLQHMRHMSSGQDTESYTAVRGVIGAQVARIFLVFARALDIEPHHSTPLAFGLVGLIESTGDRWLDDRETTTLDEISELITTWCWTLIDTTLQLTGAGIDPDTPLPELLD